MKISKIADAIGRIDTELVDGAIDCKRSRNRRWIGYAAIAACVTFAVVGAFAVQRGPSRQGLPLNPNADVTENTTVTENTNTPDTTASTELSKHDLKPDTTMPPPSGSNGEGTGGDEMRFFYQSCVTQFDEIPFELIRLCSEEDVEVWADSYTNVTIQAPDSIESYANLYSFITGLGISKEEAEIALEYYLTTDDEQIAISPEELDLIYSGDVAAITEHFATEYSIVIGENVYNPFWVYSHTREDYEAVGITQEDLDEKFEDLYVFHLSYEARAAFEEKIGSTMKYDGGTLIYRDGTIVYNSETPLVEKYFTLIDVQGEDSMALYFVSNDPDDGDTIYAGLYMWDQLIASGSDNINSFKKYEAVFRMGGYYLEKQPVPVGAVVKLAWDGYAEAEGDVRRLTWLSRIQFEDIQTPYTYAELEEFRSRLEGNYLDIAEFEDEAWCSNSNTLGYEKLNGVRPYTLVRDWKKEREEFLWHLRLVAINTESEGYVYTRAGEKYYCTGYILTGDDFASFMMALGRFDPWYSQIPTGETAEYGKLYGTKRFISGDFTLCPERIDGDKYYLATNLEEGTRLYFLDDFCFARLEKPVTTWDGRLFYGWLYRKAPEDAVAEVDDIDEETPDYPPELPAELSFLESVGYDYDGDYLWYGGERYCRDPYILSLSNCDDFTKYSEHLGDSRQSFERRDDLFANILPEGTPLYKYDDYVLAYLAEPRLEGYEYYTEENGEEIQVPVHIYGLIYRKYVE